MPVRFEVTDFVDGESWSWKVAGIPTTSHRVVDHGDHRSVEMGVPLVAWPYIAVCHIAVGRIATLAERPGPASR